MTEARPSLFSIPRLRGIADDTDVHSFVKRPRGSYLRRLNRPATREIEQLAIGARELASAVVELRERLRVIGDMSDATEQSSFREEAWAALDWLDQRFDFGEPQ